jgi:hypothetical protein
VTVVVRFTLLLLAACGSATHELPLATPQPKHPDAGGHLHDPDLDRPPPRKLLAIDWATVPLASEADARALWTQIAPTGDDWEQRLDEIPATSAIPKALALALLHEGNFACAPTPVPACSRAQPVIEPAAATATLGDPCLRRQLALWSIDQLEPAELPQVKDALRAIAALPPPESQLVADALRLASSDEALHFELLAIAWRAGQHELVSGAMNGLDEAHLIEAATNLHIDGALDGLSAQTQRAVFLKAIADDQLLAATRAQAMIELAGDDDKLAPDLRAALIAITKAPSCEAAAAAAHVLVHHGEAAFVPKRPPKTTSRKPEAILRGLCVLAAYETQARSDEPSPFASYLPARGLELVRVIYDPFNEVDADGDGDPHTERTTDLIDRATASLPDLPDLVPALQHCVKTTCTSEDHEFRFGLKATGELARLEVIDRPPCQKP